MENSINFFKPDFQPENVIYFSSIRFHSYKARLFKICNIALQTTIKYQRFIEDYRIDGQNIKRNEWESFLNEYFNCSLLKLTKQQLSNKNLLGLCYTFNDTNDQNNSYANIYLRYFSKKYEHVFWHELGHLILHGKIEVYKYISTDLREFEAEFFEYSMNFFLRDIQNQYSFNVLIKKLNSIQKKDLRNFNIYHTFLKDYGNNNRNHFCTNDLVQKTFYENIFVK